MAYLAISTVRTAQWRKVIGLGAATMALALSHVPAMAQDAQPAAGAAAPAAGAAAPAAADATKNSSFWVKICDKMQFPDPAATDPKTAKPVDKQVCVTQHERFDPNSGSLLVSSAVREVEGGDKKGLLVTVPLGMVIPAGLGVFFDDNNKDEKSITKLMFDACLPSGCTAETEATPALIDQMGKAKVMTVVAISVQGARVGFKVPMGGFTTAMTGKPTDTAKFLNARKTLLLQLRERLIARQQAAQTAAGEAIKGIQEDAAANGKAEPTPPDPTVPAKPAK